MAPSLKFLIFLTIFSIITKSEVKVRGTQVPCAFFFGDSVFDNGNNNLLNTEAKANYAPYGVDHPDGPTGRFTNGLNIPDFIAEFLDFIKPMPPYANCTKDDLFTGVNYASGSAGIRDETGSKLGDRISMNRQLQNHQTTIVRLKNNDNPVCTNQTIRRSGRRLQQNDVSACTNQTDPRVVDEHLNQCLYTVNIGSNDYLNNYLQPHAYPSSASYTPDSYGTTLVQQYSVQLRTLYSYGARKIAIFGLGLLGCVPQMLATLPPNTTTCVESTNTAVELFNTKLVSLIDDLNKDLPDAKFIYINITSISQGDPSELGITGASNSCCKIRSDGQCKQNEVPCDNRNSYIFFDNFHPTQILNFVTATRAFTGMTPTDAYPYDIKHLVTS